MIVAISRNTSYLKNWLEQKGYGVVYANECSHPVDAFIYNKYTGHEMHHNNSFTSFVNPYSFESSTSDNLCIPDPVLYNGKNCTRSSANVIRINVCGKSYDEIEAELIGKSRSLYF